MTDSQIQELLKDFQGREEALARIPRYNLYRVMLYRTNLLSHSRRIAWLMREAVPYVKKYYPNFNEERATLMAVVHDDFEIILGDIQAGNKREMDKKELYDLEAREYAAVENISARFPEMLGAYVYKDLIREGLECKTLEAKVVKYADKFDAFGEALHEVFAGNTVFTTNVVNEYGKIITPCPYYLEYFENLKGDMQDALHPLIDGTYFIFEKPERFDEIAKARNSTPHTPERLTQKSGYKPYDLWLHTILKYGDDEQRKDLYVQKEFLNKAI